MKNQWKSVIRSFKTMRYELAASRNIIQSILQYKPMRSASILRWPKQKRKTGKKQQTRKKKLIEKSGSY